MVFAEIHFDTPIQDLPIIKVLYSENLRPNKCLYIKEIFASIIGSTQGCHKKNRKRRKQKQAKVLLLMEILNKTTRACEKPVSIRELLKNRKFDITLLGLVV